MVSKAPSMLETLANRHHQQLGFQERLTHRLAAKSCEVETLEHRSTVSMANQLAGTTRYQASSRPRAQQTAGTKVPYRQGPWETLTCLEPSVSIDQGTK
jgi:hypothetical protein